MGITIAVTVAAAALVYVFGRRSAGKLTQEDALAHLAVLELPEQKSASSAPPSA